MVGISYFLPQEKEGLKNLCWGSLKEKQPSLKLLEFITIFEVLNLNDYKTTKYCPSEI